MFCVEQINKEHFKNTVWSFFLAETSERSFKYSLPRILNHAIEYLSFNRKNMFFLCYGLLFSSVVILLTKLIATVCTFNYQERSESGSQKNIYINVI